MTHGSLFSGIGGFDLAAQWMGWENIFHCEWNEFGQKILKYYWPNAISYGDITKTDFTIHRGKIDIITGGFPCQPYSLAGKRKGKADERHLWPEMLRAIREIQPGWVVGENVPGIINWSGGLVFHEVQTDLETEGYEVFPVVLPACGVNAPHRRDRIWFVAKSRDERCDNGCDNRQKRHIQTDKGITSENQSEREGWQCRSGEISSITSNTRLFRQEISEEQTTGTEQCDEGTFKNPNSSRNAQSELQQTDLSSGSSRDNKQVITNTRCSIREDGVYGEKQERKAGEFRNSDPQFDSWQDFPTQSPLCSRDDGISSKLDGITFPKWRNESIKAYGNAIVPQVAYQIFKAIEQVDNAL